MHGDTYEQYAAGFQHPIALPKELACISNVLQDMISNHYIKGTVSRRNCIALKVDIRQHVRISKTHTLGRPRWVYFDRSPPEPRRNCIGELLRFAVTTSDIQNLNFGAAFFNDFRENRNHLVETRIIQFVFSQRRNNPERKSVRHFL